MVADAVEFHILAVEPESRLGIEAERAESRRRTHGIYGLTSDDDLSEQGVDIRCIGAPQARVAHGHLLIGAAICNLRDDLAVAVKERVAHHRVLPFLAVIGEGDGHGHRPRASIFRCRHNVYAPVGDVQRCGGGEPHVAVDATARIPARVGLVAVVDAYGNDIVSIAAEIRREVVLK